MRIFALGTKIFGGGWPTFGGAVPPGPNVEPPLGRGRLKLANVKIGWLVVIRIRMWIPDHFIIFFTISE